MAAQPPLILASNSPRRRQLLALGSWAFEVRVAAVDESQRPNESPADYVLRLAETKARAVPAAPGQIVLAADTAVVDGPDILGKPRDPAEAVAMLTRLRGRMHQVYTGLAVLRVQDGLLLKELSVTDVPMRNYSDAELQAYVRSGDPLDKAGAYGIQHPEFKPVADLSGCYASVMGLPLCLVTRLLHQLELPPQADAALQCQGWLEYRCKVGEAILNGTM